MDKEGEVEGAVGETKSIGCWLFSSWGGGQSPGRGTVRKSTEWSQNYRLEYKYAVMRVYLTVGWAVLRESRTMGGMARWECRMFMEARMLG